MQWNVWKHRNHCFIGILKNMVFNEKTRFLVILGPFWTPQKRGHFGHFLEVFLEVPKPHFLMKVCVKWHFGGILGGHFWRHFLVIFWRFLAIFRDFRDFIDFQGWAIQGKIPKKVVFIDFWGVFKKTRFLVKKYLKNGQKVSKMTKKLDFDPILPYFWGFSAQTRKFRGFWRQKKRVFRIGQKSCAPPWKCHLTHTFIRKWGSKKVDFGHFLNGGVKNWSKIVKNRVFSSKIVIFIKNRVFR